MSISTITESNLCVPAVVLGNLVRPLLGEYAHQMGEYPFPDAEFKLVHQIGCE